MLEKTEGPIKNGQSRETGIVRCTRRKTKLGTGHISKTSKTQTTTQKSKNMIGFRHLSNFSAISDWHKKQKLGKGHSN
jgi:hypothetical protein